MKKFYHNSKTGEIEEYDSETAGYELRGTLMAYGDAITTGLDSREAAEDWAKKWGYCPKCDGSSSGDNGKCFRCGEKIEFRELQ